MTGMTVVSNLKVENKVCPTREPVVEKVVEGKIVSLRNSFTTNSLSNQGVKLIFQYPNSNPTFKEHFKYLMARETYLFYYKFVRCIFKSCLRRKSFCSKLNHSSGNSYTLFSNNPLEGSIFPEGYIALQNHLYSTNCYILYHA